MRFRYTIIKHPDNRRRPADPDELIHVGYFYLEPRKLKVEWDAGSMIVWAWQIVDHSPCPGETRLSRRFAEIVEVDSR